MFSKFLVLCFFSLHFVIGSAVQQDSHPITVQQTQNLQDILSMEDNLRSADCHETFSNVEKILIYYKQRNNISNKIIAEIFGCSTSLVDKFLSKQTPGCKLVGAMHKYYMENGASLFSDVKETEANGWGSRVSNFLASLSGLTPGTYKEDNNLLIRKYKKNN